MVKMVQQTKIDFVLKSKKLTEDISYFSVIIKWIRNKLNGMPVQGGLDPNILLSSKQKILDSVNNYLKIFSDYPYIFNLGHGILPETNPEMVQSLIEIVKNFK